MKCSIHENTELSKNDGTCEVCNEQHKISQIINEDCEDEDFDEEPELDEIIGFECVACGNVQSSSFSCDRCLSYSMDPIYE